MQKLKFEETIFMDAFIKLKPEELDNKLIIKIKELTEGRNDIEVTITLIDKKAEYFRTLDRSIEDLNSGRDITAFTIEEFLAYPSSKAV